MKVKPEAVLLIVDDESSVCRALSRLLDSQVREILSATNPTEAEIILRSGRVTHLICDQWFGPGQPLGIDLVTKWKKSYPAMQKGIVLTGTDIRELDAGETVDKILPKVVDPDVLIQALFDSSKDSQKVDPQSDDEDADADPDTD